MKQLKPFKMLVPEWDSIGRPSSMAQGIDRPEIHELVKAHAEKLEYWRSEDYEWYYDADCIYFWPDGEITMDGKDFSSPDITFEEISWRDFLKLTPEDVEVKPELTQEEIDILTFKQPTTSDRNEKAWELFKILLAKPGLDEQLYKLEQESGKDLGIKVYASMAFDLADEFLEQAGNK